MKESKSKSPEAPRQPFVFSENEELFSRVSDARFLAFVSDKRHIIHRAGVSTNSFGEFFFATVSKPEEDSTRTAYTFFGLGLHEYRDRYYTDEWHYYRSHHVPKASQYTLTVDDFMSLLSERQSEIAAELSRHGQSKHGKLFEQIADLTDDDGAIAEFEDFEHLLGNEDSLFE